MHTILYVFMLVFVLKSSSTHCKWKEIPCNYLFGSRKSFKIFVFRIYMYENQRFLVLIFIWKKFYLLTLELRIYIYIGFGVVLGRILVYKYTCDLWYIQTQAGDHAHVFQHLWWWRSKLHELSDYIVYNITKISAFFSVLGAICVVSFNVLYEEIPNQQIEYYRKHVERSRAWAIRTWFLLQDADVLLQFGNSLINNSLYDYFMYIQYTTARSCMFEETA